MGAAPLALSGCLAWQRAPQDQRLLTIFWIRVAQDAWRRAFSKVLKKGGPSLLFSLPFRCVFLLSAPILRAAGEDSLPLLAAMYNSGGMNPQMSGEGCLPRIPCVAEPKRAPAPCRECNTGQRAAGAGRGRASPGSAFQHTTMCVLPPCACTLPRCRDGWYGWYDDGFRGGPRRRWRWRWWRRRHGRWRGRHWRRSKDPSGECHPGLAGCRQHKLGADLPPPPLSPAQFVAGKVFLGGVSGDTTNDSLTTYASQWWVAPPS